MKKTFLEIEKMLFSNPAKWSKTCLKIAFRGLPPFSSLLPFKMLSQNDDAGGNSHISVTTGRRVMVYSAKSAETPCSYLC